MKECPIVDTSLGKIKGSTVKAVDNEREVFRYSSVPFAKPPVGELRFEAPVKPEPWNGVLDGSKHSPIPQQDRTSMRVITKYIPMLGTDDSGMSEDCLYLTVYTSNISKSANMPVLLWIYGGGFSIGGENEYNGSVLATLHDVVVVTPNYRLGVFGFFSLGPDSDYPGNNGLLDQLMAMKWTREHIQNFGGNPGNITIFGQSVGAGAVNYHVISPYSAGYFDKAISHSGSAFSEGFPQENTEYAVKMLKEELKITETDQKKLIETLKSLPAEDILKAGTAIGMKMVYFSPVLYDKIFPKQIEALAKESANSVPYIAGFNNTEGHGIMAVINPQGFADGITRESCFETLKGFIGSLMYKGLPDTAYEKMLDLYSNGKTDGKFIWSEVYGEIMSDIIFVKPTLKSVKSHHAMGKDTYMYVMTQIPKYNHDLKYGPKTAQKVPFCQCDHGDDMVFTFGLPLFNGKMTLDVKFTEEDKLLSREWMKYLTNFAMNGDPNVGEPVKVKWPKYDDKELGYLSVQQPCTVGKNCNLGRSNFWDDIIKQMQQA